MSKRKTLLITRMFIFGYMTTLLLSTTMIYP